MVESVEFGTAEWYHLSTEFGCRRGRDDLAVHNPNFATLPCQLQHQLDEVQPALRPARDAPINSGRSQNEMLLGSGTHKVFARQFRIAIDVQRAGSIRFVVRTA